LKFFAVECAKKIEDFFVSGLRKHIVAHIKASYRFKYPLLCLQCNCTGWYADLKSFIVHVKKNQIEARLTDNFDQHANQVNSPLGHFDDSYIDPGIETEARPVEFESSVKKFSRCF
jgi:hypothetical protein